jgi:mannan endo-1,4-beta-mannosidase
MRRVLSRGLAAVTCFLPALALAQAPAPKPAPAAKPAATAQVPAAQPAAAPQPAAAARNVDPKATREARQLLDFLYEIQGKYTLTAQHNYIGSGANFTGRAQELTGRLPLIWGTDFSFSYQGKEPEKFQHCGPLNLTEPGKVTRYTGGTPASTRRAIADNAVLMWRQGHVVTLMWHACPPQLGNSCDGNDIWTLDKRPTQAWWDELTTDGTKLNTAWKQQVDQVAVYLALLRDAGVPVLWRPYHEMNGVWFWWGNKKGPNGFAKLWRMMYDRFVNTHELHNLIWVWDANAPREKPGDEAYAYADFWPGDQYVDVLAADVYHDDWKPSHHDELLALGKGKPIALGEVGNPPSPETLAAQKSWTWFMPWGQLAFEGQNPERLKVIFEDPRVLTHDEVTRGEDGVYRVTPKKDPPPRPPAEPAEP